MSIGSMARKLLGERLFAVVGHYYRAVFVDLEKVARSVADAIPRFAYVLDIGGGDGAPLNYLLRLRPDIRITMIDLAPRIGGSIAPEFQSRVTTMPTMSVRQYIERGSPRPDCLLISDVVHHIPPAYREGFFNDVRDLIDDAATPVIIKDIEPGYPRSLLSLWADRYISGDKTVSLISKAELERTVSRAFGKVEARETSLFASDRPNYSIIFRRTV